MRRLCLFALWCGIAFGRSGLCAAPDRASFPERAPVDEYRIHADGGIVYDPLRREAEKTGALAAFAASATTDAALQRGPFTLACKVPAAAGAYDVVPIAYELAWPDRAADFAAQFPIAVEAVAFEDESRRCGRALNDLALPGSIDLSVELLGTITAHLVPGARHNLTRDFSDTPKTYPPFVRAPFARSGVVEAGDLVWFKLRITNIGTTILDAEGYGGCLFYPQLLRKNEKGEYDVAGEPYNLYFRDLEYLYPGESHELWVHVASSMPGYASPADAPTPQGFGIVPGEYRLRFRLMYRCYATPEPFLNIWEGPLGYACDLPFVVEREPRDAPIAPATVVVRDGGGARKITRFIHTFEEFMTAFDCHLAAPGEGVSRIAGTLYLQVAPWTKHVVLKLVRAGAGDSATAAVPIAIDCGALGVRPRFDARSCMLRDGVREPLIASQVMADMRTNVQIGPFPEQHIRARLREMAECGINFVSTTCMPWLYDDLRVPRANYQGDALKYVLDVARDEGMPVEGLGTYPFDRAANGDIAAWLTGEKRALADAGIGYGAISRAEPLLPEVNAAVWRYQFARWGDRYLQAEDGSVPISVEDTWGWMRQDVNVRHPMGALAVRAFRAWLEKKYGALGALNVAWGTAFGSFEAIEPEAGQVRNQFGHVLEYADQAHAFHDWNRAVADWDAFRTELRVKNYRDTLEVVRKDIPGATVCLRTEGGNVLVAGLDPSAPNAHFRHAYLSQRRCAAIAEIVQSSGLVRYHADYTTLPYTPSELRFLVRAAVAQGIVPVFLPQFDNMRDIALNDRYGTDYQTHYNLSAPKKGYMMHCLTALYPWFQAVAEEGGIPGILWEDYQCDGFATETQKRELRLFAAKVREAYAAPAVREARTATAAPPSDEWRRGARAMRSYGRAPDYAFSGSMSREVLESYLSRAITYSELLHGVGNVEDNVRMLASTGAKFVGRAIYRWGSEGGLEGLLGNAAVIAAKVHAADPEAILQAAAFEIVTTQVGSVAAPAWVFREFGLTPETRNFTYEDMLYEDGKFVNHWSRGQSVPDMSRPETRMWFFYLVARYIDIGCEAVHFGQVELMDKRDREHAHWRDLLARVRRYAALHARRNLLVCDAHVPSGGIVHEGALMFDFHSFPLRIDEVVEKPGQGVLKMDYLDSLFGRSAGGVTPSGWRCEHLPFLVELDNFGRSGKGGQNIGQHWIWGYDEISWFAHQSEDYRNEWLGYAWKWVREHDPNGYLEMPGSRTLADAADGKHWYFANTRSPACPDGFNQEATIKAIWEGK
jgi:hypothetical protein